MRRGERTGARARMRVRMRVRVRACDLRAIYTAAGRRSSARTRTVRCCTHTLRFDYLPHNSIAAGMARYLPAGAPPALLALPYVSPVNLPSLQGLAWRWLVLSGGAELLRRDIDRRAA